MKQFLKSLSHLKNPKKKAEQKNRDGTPFQWFCVVCGKPSSFKNPHRSSTMKPPEDKVIINCDTCGGPKLFSRSNPFRGS